MEWDMFEAQSHSIYQEADKEIINVNEKVNTYNLMYIKGVCAKTCF